MRSAVVLLSGGLDSATVLAMAQASGRRCHALTVDYGQRHVAEIEAARRVAAAGGVESHRLLHMDLRPIGGSALTDNCIAVPKFSADESTEHGKIPVTYVPARNTILLSVALGLAESIGAREIWCGVNSVDYSNYPDCRPEFIRAFHDLAKVATKAGVEGRRIIIKAPLIRMSKARIIRTGLDLGVDYSLTTSCYDPVEDGRSCGTCEACLLRRKGFRSAGAEDPAL